MNQIPGSHTDQNHNGVNDIQGVNNSRKPISVIHHRLNKYLVNHH